MSRRGRVYLVGAGPGALNLLTLQALRCLEQAEVVVYDRLVEEEILAYAPETAELLYVGKKVGHKVLEQEEINALLIEKAGEGKRVVRLKGGDPFVLGRGGEEAEALAQAGVPFTVVPGVTAAVAVPAYAGIPVTHRRLASSLAIITGHEDPGKPQSRLAWEKLATAVDTLVFLMGMENLEAICRELVKNGRSPATPVALVRWGTFPQQETLTGTLKDISSRAEAAHFGPPAVIVVGEVVALREKLRWFEVQPLFGKRVLVTRSRAQASLLSQLLAQEGAQPVELPTISIEPPPDPAALDGALSRLAEFDWLILTSANGADALFSRLLATGRDARALGGLRLCAIGEATAAALKRHGLVADLVPQDFSSRGILHSFQGQEVAGERFLLARADLAGEELAQELARRGAQVEQVVAYRTVPAPQGAARAREAFHQGIDIVTFTSSSTVQGLANLLEGDIAPLKGSTIACIGPVTAAAAERWGLRVEVMPREHTIPGLVQALVEKFTL